MIKEVVNQNEICMDCLVYMNKEGSINCIRAKCDKCGDRKIADDSWSKEQESKDKLHVKIREMRDLCDEMEAMV